jgi:DNA-binding transcriptional regulator YhcF (GntR family)
MIRIDKSLNIPLYKQIKSSIIEDIENGKYYNHQKLPNPSDICVFYNISLIVVKQAFRELAQEGWLYSISGTGAFVITTPKITIQLQDMHKIGSNVLKIGSSYTFDCIFFELLDRHTITYKVMIYYHSTPILYQEITVLHDEEPVNGLMSKQDYLRLFTHVSAFDNQLKTSILTAAESSLLNTSVKQSVLSIHSSIKRKDDIEIIINSLVPSEIIRIEANV